jgi:phosphoadenosine phosphosulfate reductase
VLSRSTIGLRSSRGHAVLSRSIGLRSSPGAPVTATASKVPDLEGLTAERVLAHAIDEHHPRLALACSFQKEETVLVHMLGQLVPDARVFTIDTGVLFPETYATWRELEQRTGVAVEVFDAADEAWTAESCCSSRKVAALERALGGLDAWVTGLRREQAPTRGTAPKLGWDEAHGLWKVSPLADWSDADVWRYVAEHDLPYNPLHDQGYSSIGCAPCTLPGSGREGRWAGQDKTECGLHGRG